MVCEHKRNNYYMANRGSKAMYPGIQADLSVDPFLAAEKIDAIKTKEFNENVQDGMGPFAKLLAKLGLGGRVGLVLFAAYWAYQTYSQNKDFTIDENLFTLANLQRLVEVILAAGLYSTAHNAVNTVDQSKSAVKTMKGPLAVTLLQDHARAADSRIQTALLTEIKKATGAMEKLAVSNERLITLRFTGPQ